MAFKVVWMKGPLVLGNMAFEELAAAIRHAEDQLPEMQTNFGITALN